MSLKIVNVSDGFGSAIVPTVVDVTSSQVQHIAITPADIANEYVTLSALPSNPTSSVLSWNGITQQYGTDYNIIGARVYFLARLLPMLSVDDYLVIYYQ